MGTTPEPPKKANDKIPAAAKTRAETIFSKSFPLIRYVKTNTATNAAKSIAAAKNSRVYPKKTTWAHTINNNPTIMIWIPAPLNPMTSLYFTWIHSPRLFLNKSANPKNSKGIYG